MQFITDTIINNKITFNIAIWKEENTVWLNRLIIPKKLRNQGLGTKIMLEFINWLDVHKYKSILLISEEYKSNKECLIKFYKKFGYTYKLNKNNSEYLFRSN